jgi:hypothetical protein
VGKRVPKSHSVDANKGVFLMVSATGRRITTISLDEETWRISQDVGNLSGFIREQLRIEAATWGDSEHTTDEKYRVLGYCNPIGERHCFKCWGESKPSKKDWKQFRLEASIWHSTLPSGRLGKKPEAPVSDAPYRKRYLGSTKPKTEAKSNETSARNPGIIKRVFQFLW